MILPKSFEAAWEPGPLQFAPQTQGQQAGHYFCLHRGSLLVDLEAPGSMWPVSGEVLVSLLEGLDASGQGNRRFIGFWQGEACWGIGLGEAAWSRFQSMQVQGLWSNLRFESLRALFNRLPDEVLAIAGRAAQILEFDRSHRFCGACATATVLHEAGRSRRCPACAETTYPRVAPAMMVLIKRDGLFGRQLLLARSPRFPSGMYSALAGFVEPSESIESCIHRESFEEVGVRIRNIQYFGSQSWPFPHSLMIAYVADYEDGEILCQEGEIEDARWFTLDALPQLPHRLSIARRLIDGVIAQVSVAP